MNEDDEEELEALEAAANAALAAADALMNPSVEQEAAEMARIKQRAKEHGVNVEAVESLEDNSLMAFHVRVEAPPTPEPRAKRKLRSRIRSKRGRRVTSATAGNVRGGHKKMEEQSITA